MMVYERRGGPGSKCVDGLELLYIIAAPLVRLARDCSEEIQSRSACWIIDLAGSTVLMLSQEL